MCGQGRLRDWLHSTSLGPLFDSSYVDDNDVRAPDTRFGELPQCPLANGGRSDVPVENFDGETFEHACQQMANASDDIAPNFTNTWQQIGKNIGNEGFAFRQNIEKIAQSPGWKSQAAQAAIDNMQQSHKAHQAASQSANIMSILVDGFSRAINSTKHQLVDMMGHYRQDTDASRVGQSAAEDAKHGYDTYAQQILQVKVYKPVIDKIRGSHPDLSGISLPNLGGGQSTPVSPGFSGTGGGGGGGGVQPSGLGSPDLPQLGNPDGPAGAGPSGPPSGGSGNPAQAAGQAAQQAGQAAQQAGQQAQNAAGQGANAAKQALDKMLNGAKGPGGLPEGVLGLGPKGLNGAVKPGGGAGAHGGGGAARTPTAKPAAQMAPPTKAAAAVPASRAGASAAGGPGAGAPAAGHRGGAAGTVHKANKALRNQKNGEEVAGETEAVVPVVGGESGDSAPAKPHST